MRRDAEVPPSDDLADMSLFTGNANKELASEITKYLQKDLGNISVRRDDRAEEKNYEQRGAVDFDSTNFHTSSVLLLIIL